MDTQLNSNLANTPTENSNSSKSTKRLLEQKNGGASLHNPHNSEAELILKQASELFYTGKITESRARLTVLLRQYPEYFQGWIFAGNLSRNLGLNDQALHSFNQAVRVTPDRWEGHLALARSLEDSGRFDEAAASYHRALLYTRDAAVIHQVMASYRLERGDAARALESLRQAIATLRLDILPQNNTYKDLQIDLGETLMRLGLTDLAHRAFERASMSDQESVLSRLAKVSFRYNLWQEASVVLQRNAELHPDSPIAWWNLAQIHVETWEMEKAESALQKAEELDPQPRAMAMRASMAYRLGEIDKARLLYAALAEREGANSPMRSSAALCALYSDTLTAKEVSMFHRELFSPLQTNSRSSDIFKNERKSNRRIRLGILSADLHHQHPVNIFMQPILARIDHNKFEVFLYFTGITYDEQTALAKQRTDHWVAASSLTNSQLARRIEEDEIDVLLELSGHTSLNRMPMLAYRTAPVQVTFLGYPGSTGVPNIDWILADSTVAPEGSEPLFTEKVLRLPHTVFCYAPEAEYPFPNYGEEYKTRPTTFGSFNNVSKLTQHTVRLWSAILHEIPTSRLVLKAPSFNSTAVINIFQERFKSEGININRIEFRGPVGLSDMMAEYADIDIALDTLPYNGGTTTLQALWMGVPVVVKEGTNFASRMGASFMRAAGLDDWVAQSDLEYVQIAVRMAGDKEKLFALKQGMRKYLLSRPAWNIDNYVIDLENAIQKAWGHHCSK